MKYFAHYVYISSNKKRKLTLSSMMLKWRPKTDLAINLNMALSVGMYNHCKLPGNCTYGRFEFETRYVLNQIEFGIIEFRPY